MSKQSFQTCITRMVTDPQFGDAVSHDKQALPTCLSELERQRLGAIAGSRGLGITRTLHKGFRLNKILGRTPLCRLLLGQKIMAVELERFWQRRLPTSFYYLQEAIAFCEYLIDRTEEGLRISYLAEVAAFELAELRLRVNSGAPRTRMEIVRFEHNSTALLGALRQGKIPPFLNEQPEILIGTINDRADVLWRIMDIETWTRLVDE